MVADRKEAAELRCRVQPRSREADAEPRPTFTGAGSVAATRRRTSRRQRFDPRFGSWRVRGRQGALRFAQRKLPVAGWTKAHDTDVAAQRESARAAGAGE